MSNPKATGFLETVLQAGGSGTFLKAPMVPADRTSLTQVRATCAVLGVPFEGCCVYRPGASFGPQAIRLASEQFMSYNIELDLDVSDHVVLVDVGDVPIIPGDRDGSHRLIEASAEEILAAGVVPIALGGDHSITLPIFRALAKVRGGRPGVIHFDTHLDTADTYAGQKVSNCTQMLRIAEMPCVNASNIVQIGIRGCLNPKEERENAERAGIHVFYMPDIERMGLEKVVDRALELATDGTDSLYLTVDIDVLDPAFAPGTCAPEPGGLTSRQLFEAVRRIAKAGVTAFDIVEVAPQYDVAGITARAAARVVLEFLTGTALFRRSGG